MLCLPEFDTYHILEQYARDPDNPRNIVALSVLKHRANTQISWRAFISRMARPDNLDKLIDLERGHILKEAKQGIIEKQADFSTMTEKEMMDVYFKALDKVGMTIDPETLAKAQQQ